MFQHSALLDTPTKQQRAYRLTHECDTPALTLSVSILLISLFSLLRVIFFSISPLFCSLVISKESNVVNNNRFRQNNCTKGYIYTIKASTYREEEESLPFWWTTMGPYLRRNMENLCHKLHMMFVNLKDNFTSKESHKWR